MQRGALSAAVVAICLLQVSCGRPKAKAVILVKEGGSSRIAGQMEFRDRGSGLVPEVCAEDNGVVFRVDSPACGGSGTAGRAYQVQKGGELKDVGPVDLAKSDDEVFRMFGIQRPK